MSGPSDSSDIELNPPSPDESSIPMEEGQSFTPISELTLNEKIESLPSSPDNVVASHIISSSPRMILADETMPHSPRIQHKFDVDYPEAPTPTMYTWKEIVKTRFQLEFWGIFVSLPAIVFLWICGYYTQLFFIDRLDKDNIDETTAPVHPTGVFATPFTAFVGVAPFATGWASWCMVFEDFAGVSKRLVKPNIFIIPLVVTMPVLLIGGIFGKETMQIIGFFAYTYAQIYYYLGARAISKSSKTPDSLSNFGGRYLLCQFIVAVGILAYTFVLGDYFFDPSMSPYIVFMMRVLLHPFIQEMLITPFRLFCLYADSFYEPGSRYRWNWLLHPFQFLFALYGRFLVLSLPSLGLQVAMVLILAAEDQFFRLSMRQRDTVYIRLLSSLKRRLTHEQALEVTNKPHLYSAYFIGDELFELCSIFLSPFLLAFYRMAPNKDSQPQGLGSLVGITILGIVAETLLDCLRTYTYADKTGKATTTVTPEPKNWFHALMLKWRNSWMILDQQIHHQWLFRSTHFTLYTSLTIFMWIVYWTNSFMSNFLCAKRVSDGVTTYFCPTGQ